LPQREFETPCDEKSANPSVLKLCEYFVPIRDGGTIGALQQLHGGHLLLLFVVIDKGLQTTLQFFRGGPPQILLHKDGRAD
jgi:hypothetical protein